ncbi:MAG: hypothetical protein H6562_15055 [Lewinellaceae bacterium]|nr:hypothetical protein [Lewinella sp.]MCB9280209.1 hypothetical protein [Lewinellaceae bacterium]
MKKKNLWTLVRILFLLLTILTFTPFVIPKGVFKPELLGMPYTLWMGILINLLMVALVWWGTRVHPGREEPES